MKKEKIQISKEEMHQKLIHSPNPTHVANFLQGGKVYKNKKKYTRKEKHRKGYE